MGFADVYLPCESRGSALSGFWDAGEEVLLRFRLVPLAASSAFFGDIVRLGRVPRKEGARPRPHQDSTNLVSLAEEGYNSRMPETDLDRILKLMAEYYTDIPQKRNVIGASAFTPERVIEQLSDRFVSPKHARYCHGYGDPHLWADNGDSREATFFRQCLVHPERRVKERRASPPRSSCGPVAQERAKLEEEYGTDGKNPAGHS